MIPVSSLDRHAATECAPAMSDGSGLFAGLPASDQDRLIKIAARITETATRVRIAFAAACPHAELFADLARSLQPAGA
jgi:hypothetical protein